MDYCIEMLNCLHRVPRHSSVLRNNLCPKAQVLCNSPGPLEIPQMKAKTPSGSSTTIMIAHRTIPKWFSIQSRKRTVAILISSQILTLELMFLIID